MHLNNISQTQSQAPAFENVDVVIQTAKYPRCINNYLSLAAHQFQA
jgi:hypothetical protein